MLHIPNPRFVKIGHWRNERAVHQDASGNIHLRVKMQCHGCGTCLSRVKQVQHRLEVMGVEGASWRDHEMYLILPPPQSETHSIYGILDYLSGILGLPVSLA